MSDREIPLAKRPLEVILAQPRGFCAGVTRAIDIVERALDIYGAPVYVRHEIVHNKHVVDSLCAKGARFVEEIEEIHRTAASHSFIQSGRRMGHDGEGETEGE